MTPERESEIRIQLDVRLRFHFAELYGDVVHLVETGMTIEQAFDSLPVGKYILLDSANNRHLQGENHA